MESKSISIYIYFGAVDQYLRSLQYIVSDIQLPVRAGEVVKYLNAFFTQLKEFGLTVSLRAAEYELQEMRDELAKLAAKDTLTSGQASKLSKAVGELKQTIRAEADGKVAFIVTDKRTDVNKLLHNVRSLLGRKVFESMPAIAQYDFEEAGKCLAFERPTAAAFHLLRGTEAMLRCLYCNIVKRKKDRVKPPLLWKAMLDHLEKRTRNRPPKELLDHLDHIRDSFRNPTQHPEKIYDIEQVQDLWGVCVDAVNRMAALL